MKNRSSFICSLIVLSLMTFGSTINANAFSGTHVSSPHISSPHISSPHISTHTGETPSRAFVPHTSTPTRTYTTTRSTITKAQANNIGKSMTSVPRINQSLDHSRAISSNSYNSIQHLSTEQKSDVVFFNNYYHGLIPASNYFIPGLQYFWLYSWMFNNQGSSHQRQFNNNNHLTGQQLKDKAKKKTYWIEINHNKMINVPKSVYQKIQKNDHIVLKDKTHLTVNGHEYKLK